MVILIIGKQGAGKTHYAMQLRDELVNEDYKVHLIDGDEWRKLKNNSDYTNEGRRRNLISAAQEAALFERRGYIVICSFIAPKKRFRKKMRSYWNESMLIYLPGGSLWKGTTFERPNFKEMKFKYN